MDWLRTKVSRDRIRYTKDGYNLDITYITDRMLAMSYPASGIEQCYRNNINSVVSFLEEKHKDHYKLYNLSNREYNVDKFHGFVKSYDWEDHHPVPMLTLFEIWHNMYDFLQDKENVVIVHWKAGKGRTGTVIACFLLYCGLAENAQDAIKYYGRKRFSSGIGVSMPCQVRAIRYFELILKGIIKSPSIRVLKGIKMHTIPHMTGKTCRPYIEILKLRQLRSLYDGKQCDHLKTYKCLCDQTDGKFQKSNTGISGEQYEVMDGLTMTKAKSNLVKNNASLDKNYELTQHVIDGDEYIVVEESVDKEDQEIANDLCKNLEEFKHKKFIQKKRKEKEQRENLNYNDIVLPHPQNKDLVDDILIKIIHKGTLRNKLICRLYFNTSFINTNTLKFTIKDCDPASLRKSKCFK